MPKFIDAQIRNLSKPIKKREGQRQFRRTTKFLTLHESSIIDNDFVAVSPTRKIIPEKANSISEIIHPDEWAPFVRIGYQIRAERRKKKVSKPQLANMVGISVPILDEIECIYVAPSRNIVRKIEIALEANFNYDERLPFIV